MSSVTPERRRVMQAVKDRDTTPELIVRKIAHGLGYRYRLHRKDLPGKPDMVFPSKRKAIFVHGCFWHRHSCKRGDRIPKTNTDYWTQKIARNVERDARNMANLKAQGWRVLVLWECELKNLEAVQRRIIRFLG